MVKRGLVILQLIKIFKYEHFAVFPFVLLSLLFFSFVSPSFFCTNEIARHYPDTLEQQTVIILGSCFIANKCFSFISLRNIA